MKYPIHFTIKKLFSKAIFSLLIAYTISLNAFSYHGIDRNGKVYKGLQNWSNVLEVLGLNEDSEEILGTIKPDLKEQLLAPWDENKISKALPRTATEMKQKALEVVQSLFYEKKDGHLKLLDRYDAAGSSYAEDEEEVQRIEQLIKQAIFTDGYHDECRAITIRESDALFAPVRTFVTNNLATHGNTASDQKSSSTAIPKNTPVFILSQITEYEGLGNPEDSWLAIWRPEFGIKFVLAKDIGILSGDELNRYKKIINSEQGLELAVTDRLKATKDYACTRLIRGTPIIIDENQESLLVESHEFTTDTEIFKNGDGEQYVSFHLFRAELIPEEVRALEEGPYRHRAKIPFQPSEVPIRTYLQHLYNAIFQFPPYVSNAPNRLFSWGEGIVGHGGQRGQDISTFIREIFLPLGLSLPRHSWDQVTRGESINPIYTSSTPDMFFDDMVRLANLGVFASFGAGNNMACLGSITLEQLAELDSDAAKDAHTTGGISTGEKVPLVVASPVGFKQPNGHWDLTPKTAIFALTRKGPYSSWTNHTREKISFFSYFTKLIPLRVF